MLQSPVRFFALFAAATALSIAASGDSSLPLYSLDPFPVEETRPDDSTQPMAWELDTSDAAPSLEQRLQSLPELSLQRRGPESLEPNVRGLTGDRIATWFNGVYLPVASPTRTAAPVNFFPGFSMDHIRMQPAVPEPVLAPAVSGAHVGISLHSPLHGGQPPSSSLSLTREENRGGYRLNAATSFEWIPDSADLRLAAHKASHGDYTAGDGRSVDADYDARSLSSVAGFLTGGGTRATVAFHFMEQQRVRNPSLPLDTLGGNYWVMAANADHPMGSGRIRATVGHASFKPFLSSRERTIPAAAPVKRIEAWPSAEASTFRLVRDWSVGNAVASLSLDYIDHSRDATRVRTLTSGPVFQDRLWPDISSRQYGMAAAWEQPLGDHTSFRLSARIDQQRQKADATDHPVLAMPGSVSGSILDNYVHFNGPAAGRIRSEDTLGAARIQLTWQPQSLVTGILELGYARTPPGPTQRYRAFVSALGGGSELGNPALEPETIRQIAARFQLQSDSFSLQWESFYGEISDFIHRQAIQQSPLVYSYRNREARLYGWAFKGEWRILSSGDFALSLPFQAAWSRTTDEVSGHRLAESPPWNASVAARAGMPLNAFSLQAEIRGRYVGAARNEEPEQVPLYADNGGAFFLEASLALARDPSAGWEIRLRARNLLDRSAFAYLQPPVTTGPVRPSSGDLLPGDRVPLAGRSLALDFQWRF